MSLESCGYSVIPFAFGNDLLKLQDGFVNMLLSFPEYQDTKRCLKEGFVMGGFSALGNPSSFHHPYVRKVRQWCMFHLIKKVFHKYEGCKLEQIIDRIMYRPIGSAPTRESWHRDEAPNALDNDKTFGGWLNLDNKPQYFSCIPGTHKEASEKGGFNKITDRAKIKELNKSKKKVEIPPGHIIIFYENILHEVCGSKAKDPMKRVFLGLRLTESKMPYFNNINHMLDVQSVMTIKSNQTPAMYSRVHTMYTKHRERLIKFSDNIIKEATMYITIKSGQYKGFRYKTVYRHMPSLKYFDRKYADYDEDEKRMHTPNTTWNLYEPFTMNKKTISMF